MRIAVVTGASSGLGREFALQIGHKYPDIDEIWLIARREERLSELSSHLGHKARVIPLDLTKGESTQLLKDLIEKENPDIKILVNSAGSGKISSTEMISEKDTDNIIELNIKALVNITLLSLPYMKTGGRIINMSSVSGYFSLPYLNTYSATKAFILHFSTALGNELKERGITVTAVCPYWVNTEFINVAKSGVPQPGAITNFKFIRASRPVAEKALSDSELGKRISVFGPLERTFILLSKTFPMKLQLIIWNAMRS